MTTLSARIEAAQPGEEDGATARARKVFGNQGMHRAAEFIAGLHPNAIDYLEQAPVLACAFGVKHNTKTDRLYVAMRVGGPIQRGERLRNVMASVGLPYPLRKLSGNALTPYVSKFIRETAAIPPSTLSQCIPAKVGDQRKWLSAIRQWRDACERRTWMSPKTGFIWLATNAQHFEEREAADIVDFLAANNPSDFERWSINRMRNEVELWHDRLNSERGVRGLGAGISLDTIIDLSDWPDHAESCGYEFFKLATPRMIMEEGRRMRHCVAYYIPRVVDGAAHIYSLREGMRRVATVEIVGSRVVQIAAFANKVPPKAAIKAADEFAAAIARSLEQ